MLLSQALIGIIAGGASYYLYTRVLFPDAPPQPPNSIPTADLIERLDQEASRSTAKYWNASGDPPPVPSQQRR